MGGCASSSSKAVGTSTLFVKYFHYNRVDGEQYFLRSSSSAADSLRDALSSSGTSTQGQPSTSLIRTLPSTPRLNSSLKVYTVTTFLPQGPQGFLQVITLDKLQDIKGSARVMVDLNVISKQEFEAYVKSRHSLARRIQWV